jgi:hypothetical protein
MNRPSRLGGPRAGENGPVGPRASAEAVRNRRDVERLGGLRPCWEGQRVWSQGGNDASLRTMGKKFFLKSPSVTSSHTINRNFLVCIP